MASRSPGIIHKSSNQMTPGTKRVFFFFFFFNPTPCYLRNSKTVNTTGILILPSSPSPPNTHTHARTHIHTRTHARTHTHTHTRCNVQRLPPPTHHQHEKAINDCSDSILILFIVLSLPPKLFYVEENCKYIYVRTISWTVKMLTKTIPKRKVAFKTRCNDSGIIIVYFHLHFAGLISKLNIFHTLHSPKNAQLYLDWKEE